VILTNRRVESLVNSSFPVGVGVGELGLAEAALAELGLVNDSGGIKTSTMARLLSKVTSMKDLEGFNSTESR